MTIADAGSRLPSSPSPFKFDGEQVVEGGTPERIWQDHQARYAFGVPMAVGRRVLDAACGTGYGSFTFASHGAADVLGVDISESAIEHARSRYQCDNLRYRLADVTALPLGDESIDVVSSFETIEHVAHSETTLRELTRVLVPRGVLLISTPNRTVTSPRKGRFDKPDNRFHQVEYTTSEFDELLGADYDILGRYGQRLVPALLYNSLVVRFAPKLVPYGYAAKHGSPQLSPLSAGWEARYLVYVCQKR